MHFNSMFTESNIFYIVIKVKLLEFHSSYFPHHHHSAFSPFLYLICEMLWSILNNVVHTHQLKKNYAQLSRAVFNSNDNFWPDSFTFWSNKNWEVFFEFPSWRIKEIALSNRNGMLPIVKAIRNMKLLDHINCIP